MRSLLSLPWELREQIYVLALEYDVPLRRSKVEVVYHVNQPSQYVKELPSDHPAGLLCTCWQIEIEASPIFYTCNEFVPYTSLYLDKINYKDDREFVRSIPHHNDWIVKSNQEKHEDLGICAKHAKHVTSLVIYDEYAQLDESNSDLRERNPALRCSNLIAEMILWLRDKAPQVQQISIRYGDRRPRLLESFSKGWIVRLPKLERRLYKAIRGFPHLRLLDIRRTYARVGAPFYWGVSEPLFELDGKDPRFKGVKGRVLGDALRRAATSKWVKPGVDTFQCGMRWCFVLDPREKLPSHYLGNSYVKQKIPPELPFEYAWSWSLDSKETWGRAQESLDREILRSESPRTIQLLQYSFLKRKLSKRADRNDLLAGVWDRIWALPIKIRALIWRFSLQRGIPIHACSYGKGDTSIDALLRVDRRTRAECYRHFIKWNIFSLLSWVSDERFGAIMQQDTLLEAAMGVVANSIVVNRRADIDHCYPSPEILTMVQAVHVDMWQVICNPAVRMRRNETFRDLMKILYKASPLLTKISIANYMNYPKWVPIIRRYTEWDLDLFPLMASFHHLQEIVLLYAFDESLYHGIPWMNRVCEVDRQHPPQVSISPVGNQDIVKRFGISGSSMKASIYRQREIDEEVFNCVCIAKDIGDRVRNVKYYRWGSVWNEDELEGFVYRLEIRPHCSDADVGCECSR